MKQAIIFSCLFFFFKYSYAQSDVQVYDVKTPKGSPVTAWDMVENTNYWRNHYDITNAATGRTYLYYFGGSYSSTRKFNCHGYAWHIAESGQPRWIGYYAYNTDEHIYWEDGSYIEVCNEMYPGKVSWGSGDHSAITTSTPGRWISKWNEGPLLEHDWDDTPYGTTNLKYYVSTAITGSNAPLCSGTRLFSVRDITNAVYTWSVSPGITIQSGGNTHAVTVSYNAPYSNAWAEVEISTPCSAQPATRRIYFDAGSPTVFYEINPYGMEDCYQANAYYYFSVVPNPGDDDIIAHEWGYRPYGTTNETIVGDPNVLNPVATIIFYSTGLYEVFVRPKNTCGTGQESATVVDVVSWCGGYFKMSAMPNPAVSQITVSLSEVSKPVKALGANADIKFEIYHFNSRSKQKQWLFKNNQETFNLNLQGLSKGFYVLTATVGSYQQSIKVWIQ
jgi:hypothetical protein